MCHSADTWSDFLDFCGKSTTFLAMASPLHRLDPRTKFAVLFCIALLLFAGRSPAALGAGAVLTILGVTFSGVPIADLFRRFRSLAWFAGVVILIQAAGSDGEVLLSVAGTAFTREGFVAGVLLSLKILLLAAGSMAFVRSTPLPEMIDALETTVAPRGGRSGALLMSLLLAVTFGPMLVDGARLLMRAHVARGADLDGRPIARLRFAAAAAVPLFVSAFRSSDQLAVAMQVRRYDPRTPRTPFRRLKLRWPDVVILLAAISATLTLLLLPAAGG